MNEDAYYDGEFTDEFLNEQADAGERLDDDTEDDYESEPSDPLLQLIFFS